MGYILALCNFCTFPEGPEVYGEVFSVCVCVVTSVHREGEIACILSYYSIYRERD